MSAKTLPQTRSAARRFADRLAADYPKAVGCLRDDLEELLSCWRYKSLAERKSCEPVVGSFQSPIPRQFMDILRIA